MSAQEWIDKADVKIKELREGIRRANETLADIKAIVKEVRGLRSDIREMYETAFEDKIAAQVEQGLNDYRVSLNGAIEKAEQSVFARFDEIVQTLLGTDPESKRQGKKSVPELIAELPYCVIHKERHSPSNVRRSCVFKEGE